ncbi:TolB family protein [Marinicella meishanensis]|uniref:TolB family protein n=1 Tax=Marinicella meishanensis TaxID=2873263 RepID=UPI001CBDA105|nr:hypothetical protein [Marinicella sp. NBU2979]
MKLYKFAEIAAFLCGFATVSVAEISIKKLTNIETSYPHWSPDDQKIVFQSNRMDDDSEIYVMNSDGTGIQRLTNSPGHDGSPIWSPDGQKILFSSTRDGNYEVYIMNADGTDPVNLTNHPANDGHPNFSPDGKNIIFNSNRSMDLEDYPTTAYTADANIDLYEMDIDGNDVRRVTDYESWDSYPDISPDGQKIAFRRRLLTDMGSTTGNSEVFIANRDGSQAFNLSNYPEHDGWPAWSPDGHLVAYASEREREGNWQIYTIKPDGSDRRRITEFDSQGASFTKPQWSSDGNRIICTRTKDGNVEIFIIALEQ